MLKIGGATSRKINFEHETPSSSSRPAVRERGCSTSRLLPPGASSLHSGIVGLTTHNNNYRGNQKEISPLPSFTATERVGGAWRVEMPSPATIGGYDYYTTSETKQRKRKRRKQKNFDEKDYDDGDDFRNTSSTTKPHTSTSVSTTTTRHRMLSPREFSKLRGEMLLSEMETLADAIGGDDSELFLGEEEMYQKQTSPKKLSPTRRGRDFSSTNEMKSRDRDGAVVDESQEARSNIVRPRTAVISNHVLGIQRRIDRALEGLVGDEYSYDNDYDNEENPRSYHQNNYRNEESDGNDGYDEKKEQRRRRVEQLEPAKNLNANETTANSPRNVNLGSLSARMRNRSLALPFTNELSGKRLPFVAPTTSTTIAMKKIPNVPPPPPPPPPQQPQGAPMSSLTSSFLTPRASGRLLLAATATLHEVGEMPRMGKSATNPTLNALKENFLVGGAQSARRPSKPPQPPLSSPPFSARGIPAGMSGASGIGGAASGSSRRKVSLSGYAKASTLLNSSRRVARDTVREGTVGGDLSPTVGYGIVETPLIVNHFRINSKTVGALDIDMDGNSKKISVRKVGGAYNMDGADHRRQVKMAESIKRRQEAYLLGPFGLLPKLEELDDEVKDDSEGEEITATQKEEVEMTPKTNNLHAMYRQAMVMSGDPSLTHDKSFAPRYLANTAAVTAKLSRSPRAGAPEANKALAHEVVRELQGVGLLPLPTTAPMVDQQTRGKDPLTGGGHPLATGSNTKSNKNGGNGIMHSQKDKDRHHEEKYEQEGNSQKNTENLEDLASVSIRGVRVADVTASEKGESSSINTPRTGAKEPTDLLKKQFSNCAPMRSSVSLSSSTVARFATSGPPSPMSNTIALLTKTPTPPPFLLSGGTATSFGSENTFRRTNKNNNTYNNGPLGTTDTSSGSKNSSQGTSAAIVPAPTSTPPYTVDLHVSRPSPHPPGSSLATPPIALSLDPSVEAAVLGTLPPPPDPTEASELNPEWSEATSHVRGIVQTASVLPDHTAAMLLRDYHENAVLEGLRVSRSANGQIWSAREAPTMLAHQRVAERQQGLVGGGGGGGGSPTSSVGTPRGRGLIVGAADTTRTHEAVGSGGSPQESSAKGPKRLSLSQSSALALSAKAESLLKALQEPK